MLVDQVKKARLFGYKRPYQTGKKVPFYGWLSDGRSQKHKKVPLQIKRVFKLWGSHLKSYRLRYVNRWRPQAAATKDKQTFLRDSRLSGKWGVWKVRSLKDEECGKYGAALWKMRSVESAECGVWKMQSVKKEINKKKK